MWWNVVECVVMWWNVVECGGMLECCGMCCNVL
jgi:hypothetical protein